jgi:hypothetical protein
MFVSSFLIVFIVLFVAWVVGFAFHLVGGLIHLLLVVARGVHRAHSPRLPNLESLPGVR